MLEWGTDITHIRTYEEFSYLSAVIDLLSQRCFQLVDAITPNNRVAR